LLGLQSFICCPIICEEEAIGVLAVDHLVRKRDFTQSDVSLLMGIAPLIGIRISNADLMTTQQQQRHEIITLERAMFELSEAKKESERYAAEVAEINEEVKNFTYIVSHDLRAPLVNIKGFSAELTCSVNEVNAAVKGCLEQLDAGEAKALTLLLDEDIPEDLDFINSSVQRMDALINAILQLSRVGRRELKEELVASGTLVEKILKSLGHQLEKQRVEVSLGELPEVTSDAVALEQLLGNLIDNAIKYLDPSRDGRLRIWAERNAGELVFHVGDNGRGIAAEDQEKIFALFRRSGKQDVQGEGMGLAYVKTLARRLGGRIWCESRLGEGSTFSFTIPA
jgi:signal transduction histidine kinase